MLWVTLVVGGASEASGVHGPRHTLLLHEPEHACLLLAEEVYSLEVVVDWAKILY